MKNDEFPLRTLTNLWTVDEVWECLRSGYLVWETAPWQYSVLDELEGIPTWSWPWPEPEVVEGMLTVSVVVEVWEQLGVSGSEILLNDQQSPDWTHNWALLGERRLLDLLLLLLLPTGVAGVVAVWVALRVPSLGCWLVSMKSRSWRFISYIFRGGGLLETVKVKSKIWAKKDC